MNKVIFKNKIDKYKKKIEKDYIREDFLSPFYVEMNLNAYYHPSDFPREFDVQEIYKEYLDFIQSNFLSNDEIIFFTNEMIEFYKNYADELQSYFDVNNKKYEIRNLKELILEVIDFLQEELKNNSNDENISVSENSQTKFENLTSDKDLRIKWSNDLKELAYLFYSLKERDVIKVNYLGKALSILFTDKDNKPIGNTIFNKYFADFRSGNYPANATIIDKLINELK